MQASAAKANVSSETLAGELHAFWMSFMRQSAPAMYRILEELDLSMTQMKTLHAVDGSAAECTVKETAELTGFSLPNASRTVDSLLKRGFIERREDEHDRRQKRLRLTDAGRDALEQIAAARLAGLEQYTAQLSAEQRDGLYAALLALPHHDEEDPA